MNIEKILKRSKRTEEKLRNKYKDFFDASYESNIKPLIPYKTQKEWLEWAFLGGIRLLLGARGYGKTESIVRVGLAERLKQGEVALIYSRNELNALRLLEYLSEENGWKLRGRRLFIKGRLSCEMRSIFGRAHKGRHFDWVIFDDPVDIMDKNSPVTLEKVKDVFYNISSIAKKGAIVIGQPVVQGDLYYDLRSILSKDRMFDAWHGSIPQLDKDLSKLDQPEHIIDMNYRGIYSFGEHSPFRNIKVEEITLRDFDICSVDPSLGGDKTGLVFVKKTNENYIVQGFLFKKAWTDVISELQGFTGLLVIESNLLGVYDKVSIQERFKVYFQRNTRNKTERILTLLKHKDNIIMSHSSDPGFINQVHGWSSLAREDDGIDALAQAIEFCSKFI